MICFCPYCGSQQLEKKKNGYIGCCTCKKEFLVRILITDTKSDFERREEKSVHQIAAPKEYYKKEGTAEKKKCIQPGQKCFVLVSAFEDTLGFAVVKCICDSKTGDFLYLKAIESIPTNKINIINWTALNASKYQIKDIGKTVFSRWDELTEYLDKIQKEEA